MLSSQSTLTFDGFQMAVTWYSSMWKIDHDTRYVANAGSALSMMLWIHFADTGRANEGSKGSARMTETEKTDPSRNAIADTW